MFVIKKNPVREDHCLLNEMSTSFSNPKSVILFFFSFSKKKFDSQWGLFPVYAGTLVGTLRPDFGRMFVIEALSQGMYKNRFRDLISQLNSSIKRALWGNS